MQYERTPAFGKQPHSLHLLNRTPALILIAAMILFPPFFAPASFAQSSDSDTSIKGIPFDLWLAGEDYKQIPWEVSVRPSGLTDYQRIWASITARIPVSGSRASQRGQLLYMVQISDANGKPYRARGVLTITNPLARKTSVDMFLDLKAFVLPGDYKFAMAIYDPLTHKHSVIHRDFYVSPIENDPLPNAWVHLPPVDFLPTDLLPDYRNERLDLPLKLTRPVHLQVIANVTPTHAHPPYVWIYQNNLSFLVPELEVLSQISLNRGSLDVIALNLTDQKVAFEQDSVQTLDWRRLKDDLNPSKASVVSVNSLSEKTQEVQFFTKEVSKRVSCGESSPTGAASDPLHVVIVVSNDMAFPKDEDLSPVSATSNCNLQVFYIRTHFDLRFDLGRSTAGSPLDELDGASYVQGGNTFATTPIDRLRYPAVTPRSRWLHPYTDKDQLENTLAPLHPRLFEVNSPEDFRKAIASILDETGRL